MEKQTAWEKLKELQKEKNREKKNG